MVKGLWVEAKVWSSVKDIQHQISQQGISVTHSEVTEALLKIAGDKVVKVLVEKKKKEGK